MTQGWILVTTATSGTSSTLRVWTWRRLRALGAHYLQQSVCLLPANPETTRAVNRVSARLRDEGAQAQVFHLALTDPAQEEAVIGAFQAERSDEYAEVIERTREFHAELAHERKRGRATYTELEESDADLARHVRWLQAIQARDYFDAPGAQEAIRAVEGCREALAGFEAEALRSEAARVGGDEHELSPSERTLRLVDEDRAS